MKTIFFARHAKSSWNQPGISDFERPLNERGLQDAPKMAQRLKKKAYLLDQIISSDAARALATAKVYQPVITPGRELLQQHKLYNARYLDIAQLVSELPANLSAVMLVGHNPGMTDIVEYYAREVIEMPTCSICKLEFEALEWQALKQGCGELRAFEYPKK